MRPDFASHRSTARVAVFVDESDPAGRRVRSRRMLIDAGWSVLRLQPDDDWAGSGCASTRTYSATEGFSALWDSPPGNLVTARGREWVVLPESTDDFLVLRPLGGGDDDIAGVLASEGVSPATFPPPHADDLGDHLSASLLRTALRIGFRSTAGPFRSLASIAVEPRAYQFVPLMMALRQDVVRLLIADDVGIGKTIEAGLIAAELLQRRRRGLAVLCSPALAEQWQGELREKFGIDAELVLPSTVRRLERGLIGAESLFDRYPVTVVSTDFIKSARRRHEFLRTCPDLVIVDEAHTCVADSTSPADRAAPALRTAPRPRRRPIPPPDPGHRHPAHRQGRGLPQPARPARPRAGHRRPRERQRAGNTWPGTSSSAAAPTSASTSTRTPRSRRTASPLRCPTAEPGVPRALHHVLDYARETVRTDEGGLAGGSAGGPRWRCCARWPPRREPRRRRCAPGPATVAADSPRRPTPSAGPSCSTRPTTRRSRPSTPPRRRHRHRGRQ